MRVVGDVPGFAVKGGDQAGFHGLLLLAVVDRIGLAGDEENLAELTAYREAIGAAAKKKSCVAGQK
mgnify:CR=1 FL=1